MSRAREEERKKKKMRRYVFALFPWRATRTSRSPRFRLCSPKIRKKITPVLQARVKKSVLKFPRRSVAGASNML